MLKIAWNQFYNHLLPENHRFPMIKYDLLPQQLLHEGTICEDNLFEPSPCIKDQACQVHFEHYWDRFVNLEFSHREELTSGFPISRKLVERELMITGGTIQACDYAHQYGIAMNVAGGTHHAYADRAEGFCLLNDMAVAARYLLRKYHLNKILIIDLDVHQGNGTAKIFEHDSHVYTFSMHGAKNYPLKKEQSDLDVALDDGTDDSQYLDHLQRCIDLIFNSIQPDFIFYQCGVDILKTDKLGRLALTLEGCKQRDRLILELAYRQEIPIACTMGGGYSSDVNIIVEAHSNTYRLAQEIFF